MCSLSENIVVVEPSLVATPQVKCAKCKTEPPSVNVRRALFCKTCFQQSLVQRFRSSLGKSTLLSSSTVLLCYSGGISSSVLLGLMADYFGVDPRKRSQILKVIVVFVDESQVYGTKSVLDRIEEIVSNTGFEFKSCEIADFYRGLTDTC